MRPCSVSATPLLTLLVLHRVGLEQPSKPTQPLTNLAALQMPYRICDLTALQRPYSIASIPVLDVPLGLCASTHRSHVDPFPQMLQLAWLLPA